MIAYRDFFVRRGGSELFGLIPLGKAVTFDEAVEAANAWIATEDVRVITVETVIVGQYGKVTGCRVWYEGSASERKKAVEPEI